MLIGWCAASPGQALDLPGTGRTVKILSVDDQNRQVTLTLT